MLIMLLLKICKELTAPEEGLLAVCRSIEGYTEVRKVTDYELKLLKSFPKSFINHLGEFIGSLKENPYFCLADCKNELDVKCKVLEWFSRPACKTQYYKTTKRNEEYHKYMLDGINRFLETDFSFEDMELIYEKLGNAVNHNLTLKFIESGYDLDVLMRQEG